MIYLDNVREESYAIFDFFDDRKYIMLQNTGITDILSENVNDLYSMQPVCDTFIKSWGSHFEKRIKH